MFVPFRPTLGRTQPVHRVLGELSLGEKVRGGRGGGMKLTTFLLPEPELFPHVLHGLQQGQLRLLLYDLAVDGKEYFFSRTQKR